MIRPSLKRILTESGRVFCIGGVNADNPTEVTQYDMETVRKIICKKYWYRFGRLKIIALVHPNIASHVLGNMGGVREPSPWTFYGLDDVMATYKNIDFVKMNERTAEDLLPTSLNVNTTYPIIIFPSKDRVAIDDCIVMCCTL